MSPTPFESKFYIRFRTKSGKKSANWDDDRFSEKQTIPLCVIELFSPFNATLNIIRMKRQFTPLCSVDIFSLNGANSCVKSGRLNS